MDVDKVTQQITLAKEACIEGFENKITQLHPTLVQVMEDYNHAKIHHKLKPEIYIHIEDAVKAEALSESAAGEIVSHVHTMFPSLSERLQKSLQKIHVLIRVKPRPVISLAKSKQDDTFLSLFSFDVNDTGPHFPIQKVFEEVTKRLRAQDIMTWKNIGNMQVEINNPFNTKPKRSNTLDLPRILTWHNCFQDMIRLRKNLSERDLEKLDQYDIYFYPEEVQALDTSWLGRAWQTVKSTTGWLVDTIVQNQFLVMILRNLMCVGITLLMARWLNLKIDLRRVITNILFGFFYHSLWIVFRTYVKEIQDQVFHLLSGMGAFGRAIALFFQMMSSSLTGDIPISLQGYGRIVQFMVQVVKHFGANFVVAFEVLLGWKSSTDLLNSLGFVGISTMWESAVNFMYDSLITMVNREMVGFSAAFAVHGTRFLCALLGWTSDQGSETRTYCETFSDAINYVFKATSLGYIIFDVYSDIRLLWQVRNGTFKESDITANSQSSCIRILYESHDFKSEQAPGAQEAPKKFEEAPIKIDVPNSIVSDILGETPVNQTKFVPVIDVPSPKAHFSLPRLNKWQKAVYHAQKQAPDTDSFI